MTGKQPPPKQHPTLDHRAPWTIAHRSAENSVMICSLSRLATAFSWLVLPAFLVLPSCGSVLTVGTADVAGVAGAGAANAVTKSAAVATGIGLAVASGANAGLAYAERRVHRYEQDRIAEAAGALAAGVVGSWSVVHDIAIEDDEHGQLVVSREIGSTAFACREIVFSVDTVEDKQPQRAFYTATVCRDGTRWKWASAEPATERWGSLQ